MRHPAVIARSVLNVALTAMLLVSVPVIATAEGGTILQATLGDSGQKTAEVSTEELRRILADHGAVVIDARTRSEYVAGHIPSAVNVDATQSEAVDEVERVVRGDKKKAVVLYCNGPFCRASRYLGDQLVAAGFSQVRRYQLGIPIWRALGGPTEIELDGIVRIFNVDRTAVFLDARTPKEFAKGSVPGAHNVPADQLASGALDHAPLPKNDFNTRIVLFGRDAAQARVLADALSTKPWHNVTYYAGGFDTLQAAIK